MRRETASDLVAFLVVARDTRPNGALNQFLCTGHQPVQIS